MKFSLKRKPVAVRRIWMIADQRISGYSSVDSKSASAADAHADFGTRDTSNNASAAFGFEVPMPTGRGMVGTSIRRLAMPSRSFRVGRSASGLGLFATKPIKRTAYIATYRGRRISTEESEERERRGAKYMFELNRRWTIDGSSRWNVARYLNHSCRPNAKPVLRKGRIVFVALRRIAPGEEITLRLRTRIFRLLHQAVGLPLRRVRGKGGEGKGAPVAAPTLGRLIRCDMQSRACVIALATYASAPLQSAGRGPR